MSLSKLLVLAMLHLLAVPLIAAPALAAEEPAIDPRAEQILKATADYLKEAGQFVFHAEVTLDDDLPSGLMVEHSGSVKAALKRPNRMRYLFSGDLPYSSYWYDGKTFTMLKTGLNLYAQWAAPSKLDSMMDKLQEKTGVAFPLPSLFSSDPYKSWMDGALVVVYGGKSLVRGKPAHHIIMIQEEIDAQIWIEEGEQLVLRKVVLTDKTVFGNPRFTAVFSDWDFSPRFSDLIFTFVPPEGAGKIKFHQASR